MQNEFKFRKSALALGSGKALAVDSAITAGSVTAVAGQTKL